MEKEKVILVIDDEDSIRETISEFLEIYDFQVVQASNGQEAIEIYKKHTAEIALILSDINMPIKNGVDFFLELKSTTDFNEPFYFITGGSNISLLEVQDKISGIIYKPFSFSELEEIVEDILNKQV